MKKRKLMRSLLALTLTFAMLSAPVAYAENENPQQSTVKEENEQSGAEGTEQPEKPVVPGETGTPGWYQQGSDWYYYDASGVKALGWRRIGGTWYYFDGGNTEKPGLMLADGKYGIGGQTYFFTASGAMQTGWILRPEGWYYANGSGAMLTGWQFLGGTWYYLDGTNETYPGRMAENCRQVIGNATYFFAVGGAMRTGWIQEPEGWYYADAVSATGWKWVRGAWYYLDGSNQEYPGLMSAGEKKAIDGSVYFFDGSGAMCTGWILKPEGWYYAAGNGSQIAGWAKVGGAWYYLNPENKEYLGLMLADEKKVIGNATYFFNRNGAMRTDWISQPEGWYYADAASSVGWKWVRGAWYYLDGANEEYPGLMIADEKRVIDGSTYFFNASGAMLTGWIQRPEGWYYASSNGAMVIGWVKSGGAWYYLNGADTECPGRMIQNCTVEIGGQEYTFTESGAMRAGWVKDQEGHWYYYHPESGQMTSGWQLVGGAWYYLDPVNKNQMLEGGWHVINGAWYYMHGSGAMATNWLNLGGEWYFLAGDGAMRTGWQWIDNNWYYFYTANDPHGGVYGMMARNTTIDGYRLQGNGAMLSAEQSGMALKAQAYSSNTNYLLMVDRASCRVGVFTGRTGAWNMNYYWSCSPGAPSTPTVGGVFKVQSKGYYFDSGSSRCYWYTQFYGNYLFHSVLYNKYTGALADGRLGMHLSHGCVRLEIGNAKWIYDTVPSGTTVVIY